VCEPGQWFVNGIQTKDRGERKEDVHRLPLARRQFLELSVETGGNCEGSLKSYDKRLNDI